MKNLIKYIIFLAFMPAQIQAQHLEIGGMLGAANYWGDLAPSIVMKETHVAYGMYARINLSSSFAFTASLTSATVSGNDNNFAYTKVRNLSFTTPLTEYSGIIEFNFFKFGVDVLDKKFSPYVFVGLGVTQYDPQTTIGGNTVHLRNIQTENVAYSSSATCIPFGIGVKWQFHRHFAAEANVNFRRMFTDYLDDVSTVYPDPAQTLIKKGGVGGYVTDPSSGLNSGTPIFSKGDRRGNSDYNDWYVTTSVSISYRFYKRTKCRRFY